MTEIEKFIKENDVPIRKPSAFEGVAYGWSFILDKSGKHIVYTTPDGTQYLLDDFEPLRQGENST